MATISGLYRKVKALDTDAVIDKAIDSTVANLEDINRERMLDGVRADGSIMPHYSYISQTVYGYPDTPIKLKDTGAFQENIFAKREGDLIVTESADAKSDKLKKKYGPHIFGVFGDYKKEYISKNLGPAFRAEITSLTGLKFG